MAIVTYSCTKCIPIDRAIIDAYRALKAMDDKAQANEEYRKNRSNADHDRALADHGMYESDHSQAGDDHFYAAQDRQTAASDHTQAQADHTQAQHDHEVAQEDHDYIESLDFSEFVKKTTTDLVNYYTKSQTYSKTEVQALIAAIPGFTYEPVPVLPTASADTMWKLYLVPSSDPQTSNVKDEFITVDNGSSVNPRYTWEQIGSTAIDLSDYVTSDALADALAGLNDVKYTVQSLTDAQKAQARTNIGATAPEVFWATFGETTATEVAAKVTAGVVVLCLRSNIVYSVTSLSSGDYITFGAIYGGSSYYLLLKKTDDTWQAGSNALENTSNKTQDIDGNKTSTTKYPSVKAVYDKLKKRPIMDSEDPTTLNPLNLESANNKVQSLAGNEADESKYLSTKGVAAALYKRGVVSQTQTWTGSGAIPRTYEMSNQVYGFIPKSNIDLYEAAGAVFNEASGYFELNGLTDISYDEMSGIYACSIGGVPIGGRSTQFANYNKRTTLPLKATSSFPMNASYIFYGAGSIEVVAFDGIMYVGAPNNSSGMFQGCGNLRRVIGGYIKVNGSGAVTPCTNCHSLESIHIHSINGNTSLAQSSLLEVESVAYMVQNAANTSAITITLHATAYARMQADTTNYTYDGNTYTGILAYAAAKNITIASA